MRPLTLHISALNDAEYSVYTTSLHDLAELSEPGDCDAIRDDAYYERISVGVREVRAWLRGRYPELHVSDLDMILKLFHPTPDPNDYLTGGQFFAVLRLVTHTHEGLGVERGLVFVQAHPDLPTSRPQSPPKRPNPLPSYPSSQSQPYPPAPPPPPTRHHRSSQSLSVSASPNDKLEPYIHPARSSSDSNTRPPQHPDSHSRSSFDRPQDSRPVFEPPPIPTLLAPKSNNPFLRRANSSKTTTPRSSFEEKDGEKDRIPPLPPRKPVAPPPPPRHSSLHVPASSSMASGQPSTSAIKAPNPPPVTNPKPTSLSTSLKPAHAVSPLMRQSLEASKVGQSIRKMEERLEQERVMMVLRSSGGSGSGRARSSSPTKFGPGLGSGTGAGMRNGSISSGPPSIGYPGDGITPPLPRRPSAMSSASSSSASVSSVGSASLKQVASASLNPFRTGGVGDERSFRSISPPPPPRPHHHHHPTPSRSRSPTRLDTTTTTTISPGPSQPNSPLKSAPPTHPDRKPHPPSLSIGNSAIGDSPEGSPATPTSVNGRVGRSKSMHQPSPPPIPPPPRRKRPESVQLLSALDNANSTTMTPPHSAPLSRHSSLSYHSRTPASTDQTQGDSPLANLQRTFTSLQLKAVPKLEKARYKAEAGLMRKRGYVNHSHLKGGMWKDGGEDGLMEGESGEGDDGGFGVDDGVAGVDEEGEGGGGERGREGFGERDNMKWPAGQGWERL
ncbi:hypothetical protein JAAARDRAFT_51495 [Jaapia argillacea MUCL 33604]|uniref:Uncharacterized protein n=1 Tax=Jaapia argillacea MUCL 33604 TaxID=933084 RepID=A0A067P899_9AGAM|nr:hypothetical protein JAAARDRAFT_51495 [Jaapia argillacea MUCL 33604]